MVEIWEETFWIIPMDSLKLYIKSWNSLKVKNVTPRIQLFDLIELFKILFELVDMLNWL